MTDKQIIKALELCHTMDGTISCYDCPCYDFKKDECRGFDHTDLLDLINRKKAEIEELRKGFTADADYFASEYDTKIKAEAIKEFAERLKAELRLSTGNNGGFVPSMIDNLVKEMVGENNG